MSAAGMIAEARRWIGTSGRPNKITKEYAARHGDEFLRASWCDMAITYWARHSGNASAVLPGGDRAYTVWHAQDFQKAGRWHSGTTANVDRAKPGDIVFFDWGSTNAVGAIDHVGLVEKVLGGGRLVVIEGNTADACKRRVRSSSVIAGLGRPAYGSGGTPATSEEDPLLGLKMGDEGREVKALQEVLRNCGPEFAKMIDDAGGSDGKYGDGTARTVRAVRIKGGSKDARTNTKAGDSVEPYGYGQIWAVFSRHQALLALGKS